MRNVYSHTKIIVQKRCWLQLLLSLWITNCYLPTVKNRNSSMFYVLQKCSKTPLPLHWTQATSPGENSSEIISCTSRKNSNWGRGNKILLVYCIVRIRVLNLPCHGAILHQANKNTEPDYLIMLAGGKTNHPQLKNSIVWTVQNAQFSITIEDEFET